MSPERIDVLANVNVLAVMDEFIDCSSYSTSREPLCMRDARAAVAELIERAEYVCRTGEGMLALRAALARVRGA